MNNKIFAKRLELVKTQKGLRNADIAEAIGVNRSQISHYSKGQQPRGDKLIKLAKFLNVDSDWLIGADTPGEYDFTTQEFEAKNLTDDEYNLLNSISKDKSLKDRLLAYAQKLHEILQEEDNL